MSTPRHILRFAFFLLVSLCAPLAAGSIAAAEPQGKGGMEVFATVDPYTKGDPELVERLGYTRLGPGPWRASETTRTLQETMGGIDMLFVETAHFRIASSLGTYKISNDRQERHRIKEELGRLEEKLGKLKAPKKKLDPWLRLHLYAQRAEDQYAEFREELGVAVEDFEAPGEFLGLPEKFSLILCQRSSEFGRYLRHYHDSRGGLSYHTILPGEAMIAAVDLEALLEGWQGKPDLPFDAMLHDLVAATLTAGFLDACGNASGSVPPWLLYGLSHSHLRRVDPRWPLFDGRESSSGGRADHWKWEPRVYKLVKNDFFAKTEQIFAWREYADLDQRDHMVTWSKTEFLLDELGGDLKPFLDAIRTPPGGGESDEQLVARQSAALEEHFGLTPEELDKAWSKWVSKTYRKR